MKIYIIGMPGCGKSTVARQLAKKLNYPSIDLDGQIEKNALMFIDEIFEKYGEEKFRELESEALKSLKDKNLVVACGGGIVTRKKNKTLMDGYVIYLDTELEVIRKRLETDYVRPLLRKKSLDTLYQERYLKYLDFADTIISNDYDVDQTVTQILSILEKGKVL